MLANRNGGAWALSVGGRSEIGNFSYEKTDGFRRYKSSGVSKAIIVSIEP